jgi:lysozyme family protein
MVFDQIVENIIRREGGYTHHKSDPGGRTKYGISQRSYPHLDIRSLTKEDAKRIYFEDYWNPSKVERIKSELRDTFFDMVVNMGQRRAVRILQKAINSKHKTLKEDGLIGKKTIAASKRISNSRLKVFRILYYADLVDRRPSLEVFIVGWIRRAMET